MGIDTQVNRLADLDRKIEELRKRLAAAERMRSLLEEDPGLLDFIQGEIGVKGGVAHVESQDETELRRNRKRVPTGSTLFDRVYGGEVAQQTFAQIASVMVPSDRKFTVTDLVILTGIERSKIVQCVYRTHQAVFVPHPVPGHGSNKAWTLKPNWKEIVEESQKG